MAHQLTKHRPGRKSELPPPAEQKRVVELPGRLRGEPPIGMGRLDSVTLGYVEPSDGRYVSLARTSFQHRSVKPAGEAAVSPATLEQIVAEKQIRSRINNEKQFYLGPSEDEVDRFVAERVRSCTPTSTMLQSYQQTAKQRGAASPAPSDDTAAKACAEDVERSHKNALAMRACHLYVSSQDQAAWKSGSASLMRTDIGSGMSGAKAISPQERASLRDSQRSTHFLLGTDATKQQSEAQIQFRGEMPQERTTSRLGKASAASTVQLGMSTVNVRDTLRSLVQVDYVPHGEALVALQNERRAAAKHASSGAVVTAETDSLVFGYDGHVGASQRPPSQLQHTTTLYRSSYTPMSFV